MKLTNKWLKVLSAYLVIGSFLLFGYTALATNYNCSDPSAPWNSTGAAKSSGDKLQATGAFSCVTNPDIHAYTRIVTVPSKNSSCNTNYGCAICSGANQICARIADCESRFGSEGYSCQDIDPFSKPSNMECVIFHCSYGIYAVGGQNISVDNTCCRTKKTSTTTTPPPDTGEECETALDCPFPKICCWDKGNICLPLEECQNTQEDTDPPIDEEDPVPEEDCRDTGCPPGQECCEYTNYTCVDEDLCDPDIDIPDEDLIDIGGGTVTSPKSPKPKTTVKTPTTQSSISFNLSTCCQSIVRPLSRNAETGIVDVDQYTLNDIVQSAINVYECILCIVGALMLIMTIVGSTMLIVSGGSSDKVALGRKIIVGAVVGGIIAFTTYLIIYWTVTALGAKFLSPYSAPSDSGDLRVDPGGKANFQQIIK